jgi:hypothetical protein
MRIGIRKTLICGCSLEMLDFLDLNILPDCFIPLAKPERLYFIISTKYCILHIFFWFTLANLKLYKKSYVIWGR